MQKSTIVQLFCSYYASPASKKKTECVRDVSSFLWNSFGCVLFTVTTHDLDRIDQILGTNWVQTCLDRLEEQNKIFIRECQSVNAFDAKMSYSIIVVSFFCKRINTDIDRNTCLSLSRIVLFKYKQVYFITRCSYNTSTIQIQNVFQFFFSSIDFFVCIQC